VLEAAAAAARRGQPQVVLVEGQAGAGKSTLLARFAAGLAEATVLRASGDETELLLPYGVVGQLTASARGTGGRPGLLAAELSDGVDPLAVGADLVAWLDQCCRGPPAWVAWGRGRWRGDWPPLARPPGRRRCPRCPRCPG